MAFVFEDEYLQSFYLALSDALRLEFNFTKQVAAGQLDLRSDVLEKYLNTLNNGLSFLGGIGGPIKIGTDIVQWIASYVIDKHHGDKKQRTKAFVSSLNKCDTSKQYEVHINNIAREVTYRYGVNLTYLIMSHQEEANHFRIIEMLSHVAALRIMFFALKEQISIEDCETLVNGLIDGYEGMDGQQLSHTLSKVSIFERLRNSENIYSAEGFYARCGFVVPSDLELIYYIDRDLRNKFVSLRRDTSAPGKPLSTPAEGNDQRNGLVPKYGYAMVTSLPTTQHFPEGLGRHFPTRAGESRPTNPFLPAIVTARYRPVSQQHLENYLAYSMSIKGQKVFSFSQWLRQMYPAVFQGASTFPIFRGSVDETTLKARGLSFSNAIFEGCDFSYCKFNNVPFHTMSNCLLVGSSFQGCSGTAACFSGSDLTMSSISNCNFQRLQGIFVVNFAIISNSFFNGSRLMMQYEGLTIDAASSDSFADCKTENRGKEESLGMRIKESQLLLERKLANIKAEEARRFREQNEHLQAYNVSVEEQIAEIRSIVMQKTDEMKAEVQKNKATSGAAPASFADFSDDEKQRILAFHKTTIHESIQNLQKVVTEDAILEKLFDSLFFTKPIMLLKELSSVPDNMPWCDVPRKLEYHVDGYRGPDGTAGGDGQNGANGGGSGSAGADGKDGQAGSAAGSMQVSLISVPNQNIFLVTPKAANPVILPLFDWSVSVLLSARGGDGGDGGRGGRGGSGTNGLNGQDASPDRAGTSGSNGGNGGTGGNGGRGGNAGLSGNIEIYVKEADVDLLACLDKTDVSEAKGGKGGTYGVGGTGGTGGRGGKPSQKQISTRNADGSYSYDTVPIAGGSPGANGRAGVDGLSGSDGLNGRKGKLTFFVVPTTGGNVQECSRIFDLRLLKFADFTSPTGIIEPGQQLIVKDIVLSNVGGMTCQKNRMEISLLSGNMLVLGENRNFPLTEDILMGSHLSLDSAAQFDFKIAKVATPETGTVFITGASVKLAATVLRLKRPMTHFNDTPKGILIRYPVEVSRICGAHCVSLGRRIPFAFKIRNVSLVALGAFAVKVPRRVRLELKVPSQQFTDLHASFKVEHNNSTSTVFSLESAVQVDVNYLAAGEEIVLCGSVSIHNLPGNLCYSRIPLEWSLSLGDLEHPMTSAAMNVIQREAISFQVAEPLRLPLLENDLILVVNHTTTSDVVDRWKEIATMFRMQVNVWNLSLYCGFSYFAPDMSIVESIKTGMVVFLNTPYTRDDNAAFFDSAFMPLEHLARGELFEAARRYGVRTYVVNHKRPVDSAFYNVLPNCVIPTVGLMRGEAVVVPIAETKAEEVQQNNEPAVPAIASSSKKASSAGKKKKKKRQIKLPSRSVGERSRPNLLDDLDNVPEESEAHLDALMRATLDPMPSAPPLASEETEDPQPPSAPVDDLVAVQIESEPEEEDDGETDYGSEDDEPAAPMSKPNSAKPPARIVNHFEFESRTSFYAYLDTYAGGRDDRLLPHYQYVSIRQTRIFTSPDQCALTKRVNVLVNKVDFLSPGRQYFYYAKLEPQRLYNTGAFLPRWIVGDVEVRRGLDTSYAIVACRNASGSSSHSLDRSVVAKLLPFARKLEYFGAILVPGQDLHQLIGDMIISDLADEQFVLIDHSERFSQSFDEDKSRRLSPALVAFSQYDFHGLCETSGGKETLKRLFVCLQALLSRYPRTIGFFASKLRKSFELIVETIKPVYFADMSPEQWIRDAEAYLKTLGNPAMQKLVSVLRDPAKFTLQDISLNHWDLKKDCMVQTDSLKLFAPRHAEIQRNRFGPRADGSFESGNEDDFFTKPCRFRTNLPVVCPDEEGKTIAEERKAGQEGYVHYHGTLLDEVSVEA